MASSYLHALYRSMLARAGQLPLEALTHITTQALSEEKRDSALVIALLGRAELPDALADELLLDSRMPAQNDPSRKQSEPYGDAVHALRQQNYNLHALRYRCKSNTPFARACSELLNTPPELLAVLTEPAMPLSVRTSALAHRSCPDSAALAALTDILTAQHDDFTIVQELPKALRGPAAQRLAARLLPTVIDSGYYSLAPALFTKDLDTAARVNALLHWVPLTECVLFQGSYFV